MSGARLVLVDDDLDLTRVVRSTLQEEGYEVIVAHDGEEGLETILVEQPDLVVLDVMMPKLNGWEVAKYLRAKPEWNDTPILMLTGIGKTLNDMTAPLYGADDHLDKPFDFDELLVKIAQLLESKA